MKGVGVGAAAMFATGAVNCGSMLRLLTAGVASAAAFTFFAFGVFFSAFGGGGGGSFAGTASSSSDSSSLELSSSDEEASLSSSSSAPGVAPLTASADGDLR